MHVLQTVYKQRQFDGKWQKLGKILDHENAYVYFTETKQKISLVPEKWITLNVFDYELEFIDT